MSERPHAHRVLVVDDEPNIVDVVAMALRFQGFAVESAGTGADALAKVSSFKPQLIVLDVMLPDMEGFDAGHRDPLVALETWVFARRRHTAASPAEQRVAS